MYHERSRSRTLDIFARRVPPKKDGDEDFDVDVIHEAVLEEKDDFPIEGDSNEKESATRKTSKKIDKIEQKDKEKSKKGEWLGKLDPDGKKPSKRKVVRNARPAQRNKGSAVDLLTGELHSMGFSHHG